MTLLALSAALLGACEARWEVEGEVTVPSGLDNNRPMQVILCQREEPPMEDVPCADPVFVLVDRDTLPDRKVAFAKDDLSCDQPFFTITAWSPPVGDPRRHEDGWREPQPGDYFANSGWHKQHDCGLTSPFVVELGVVQLP